MRLLPSVSVILSVKNGAQYLEESLRSVLAQDHRPCEILVLDDRSTDETESITRPFATDGVRFIANRSPLGIAGSRNAGIQLAGGQLLAFASHDDIWVPHKLRKQAERFAARHQRPPDADLRGPGARVHRRRVEPRDDRHGQRQPASNVAGRQR